jgi:hypothetical protein
MHFGLGVDEIHLRSGFEKYMPLQTSAMDAGMRVRRHHSTSLYGHEMSSLRRDERATSGCEGGVRPGRAAVCWRGSHGVRLRPESQTPIPLRAVWRAFLLPHGRFASLACVMDFILGRAGLRHSGYVGEQRPRVTYWWVATKRGGRRKNGGTRGTGKNWDC